jgi:predicted nucleic acid-binding Zn ribbon protein
MCATVASHKRRADVDAREPVELRDALAAVTSKLGMPPPDVTETLAQALADVVGTQLAAHTRVRSVRDGTCVVEVDAPAVATRVRYLTETFAAHANEALGGPLVRVVNVVVKGP